MDALFDLDQDFEGEEPKERRSFKYFAAEDINTTFFNFDEHADKHRVDDYGPKPKQGKLLTLDKLAYTVRKCDDEGGIYRMTLERVRQS